MSNCTPPCDLCTKLRTDGPTLAQWVKAGYQPEHYPPHGYAPKPLPKLPRTYQVLPTASGGYHRRIR